MAPSAASGNEASTGRANSRTPRIEASAVSEYAWVCAPAASPMAVLLPLLLIGKPRSRPAPAFDTPRASSSWLASMLSPPRSNARPVSTSSLKATRSTPSAGSISSRTSLRSTLGSPGVGRPAGICPTSATPCCPRPKIAQTAVLSSTAASGPGSRGHRDCAVNRNTSTAAAITTSPGFTCASRPANETTWAMKLSPVTGRR